MLENIKKSLQGLKNPKKAVVLQRFFKTRKGEYGEGDVFLGIAVPLQRIIAKKYYQELSFDDQHKLLINKIHEYRLTALFCLVLQFQKGDEKKRKATYEFYLRHTKGINNWDMVDLSAPNIVGAFLLDKKERKVLYKLARSKNIWEKRIAMLATYQFIKNNNFDDAINIAEILLRDKHDLIHKAVGWMLREIGKRNQKTEIEFLKKYHKQMPRVMLRYAVEKFSEKQKTAFLSNK
jgi:3-methyladenine DNA glycosylase AlkD